MLQLFKFNFRYISIFKATVKDDMQKAKTAMKTMGPAKVEVPSPKDFLKKHSKEKTLPPSRFYHAFFLILKALAGDLTIIVLLMNIKRAQVIAALPHIKQNLTRRKWK